MDSIACIFDVVCSPCMLYGSEAIPADGICVCGEGVVQRGALRLEMAMSRLLVCALDRSFERSCNSTGCIASMATYACATYMTGMQRASSTMKAEWHIRLTSTGGCRRARPRVPDAIAGILAQKCKPHHPRTGCALTIRTGPPPSYSSASTSLSGC